MTIWHETILLEESIAWRLLTLLLTMTSEAQRGKMEEKAGLRQPKKRVCAPMEMREWGIVERERTFANCVSLMCQHPDYLNEITQLKMGQTLEDSALKETHSRAAAPRRGWPTHSSKHRGEVKSHLTAVRTADSEGKPRRRWVLAKETGSLLLIMCELWRQWGASPKLKTGLPRCAAAPLLGVCSQELKSLSQTGGSILIFMAVKLQPTKLQDNLFVPG